jgi:hypothetical protein
MATKIIPIHPGKDNSNVVMTLKLVYAPLLMVPFQVKKETPDDNTTFQYLLLKTCFEPS